MATDKEPAADNPAADNNVTSPDGDPESPTQDLPGAAEHLHTREETPEQDHAPSGTVPLVTVDSTAGSDDAAALPALGVPLLQPPAPEHLPKVSGGPADSTNDDGVDPGLATPTTGSAQQNTTASAAKDDAPGDRSARREKDNGPEPASSLTADRLLAGQRRPPVGGWRRLLYKATFGYVNLGDSDAVRIRRALEHRIAVRLGERTRYVPVLSRKGGVGKTTVTTLLGMALADIREDRIIAMDANPDRGTLSDRSPGKADSTARQLVQNRFMVDSFAQLSSYVTRDGSRLHVLASDTDPAVAQAFDDADYRAVTDILGRYYSIVLTDSGTGMVHSVMKGTLEKADSVVLVSGGSVDEARLASETLSWLEAHGRHDLVAKAIVVVNLSSGSRTEVNVTEIEDHFRSRVGTVVRIPYDRHLAEGSRVDLAKLQPRTREAVVELAAHVVDHLHS